MLLPMQRVAQAASVKHLRRADQCYGRFRVDAR